MLVAVLYIYIYKTNRIGGITNLLTLVIVILSLTYYQELIILLVSLLCKKAKVL